MSDMIRYEYKGNFIIFASILEYIEINLCNEFSQNDIANNCYCSLSSIQKIWKYATHTSIKEYISKRRLTKAAKDLIGSDMTVLEIAMKYQYNSHEVFTRAFTKQWGCSPIKFKSHWKNSCELYPKINKSFYEEADIMDSKKFDVSELFDYLKERENTYALCFDIVGLMPVNTNIGRDAGDKVILESFKRLNDATTDDMLVFRIGGDEFVLITGFTNPNDAENLANKILNQNGNTIKHNNEEIPVSLRAGGIKIQSHLKYSILFSDFDDVINTSRNNGKLTFK